MSSLIFVQRNFEWGEGCGFGWRGRWRDWRKIASKYDKKFLISKQALRHFNKLDLPIHLSKYSINFLTPQPFGEKYFRGEIFLSLSWVQKKFFEHNKISGNILSLIHNMNSICRLCKLIICIFPQIRVIGS